MSRTARLNQPALIAQVLTMTTDAPDDPHPAAPVAPVKVQVGITEISRAMYIVASRARQQAAREVARLATIIADIEHDPTDVAAWEPNLRAALKDLRDSTEQERLHAAVFSGDAEYEVFQR